MRVCVIGAGAAGLSSARHAIDDKYGNSCMIFEQTGEIGGTWVYSDQIGTDENGMPVHTSMYKNLRTNLAKEAMGFPDFQIPDYEESYITQEQILAFLKSYTDHFNLRSLIQFYHRVKYIEPQGNIWKVTVTNLKTKEDIVYEFDAVMICNGHYHTPNYPIISGSDIFAGIQRHSRDYRDAEEFKDQKVLVLGAGFSGMDIALQLATTAKEVYLSHHKQEIKTKFPENLILKPDVLSLTKDEIIFKDNSKANADAIIYCTGYLYSFPFLDGKSGITVDDNHVTPLYKHLININNPTMCFVGLQFLVCAFPLFDLQARFFLEFLKGHFTLPSKEEMLEELNRNMTELFSKGYSNKHAHMLGAKQAEYFEMLSSQANIQPLPPVIVKLHSEATNRFADDVVNFRNDVFRIVDDNNFVRVK